MHNSTLVCHGKSKSDLELLGQSAGILPGEHQLSAEVLNPFPQPFHLIFTFATGRDRQQLAVTQAVTAVQQFSRTGKMRYFILYTKKAESVGCAFRVPRQLVETSVLHLIDALARL